MSVNVETKQLKTSVTFEYVFLQINGFSVRTDREFITDYHETMPHRYSRKMF